MLTKIELNKYLQKLEEPQREAVSKTRSLILKYNPNLTESVDKGKWFTGLLTYSSPGGIFLFALGPRANGKTTFHMMPYYGSAKLRAKYGPSLKKFLTGKSCIQFKNFDDLPQASIIGIIKSAPLMLKYATTNKPKSPKKIKAN